MGPKTANGRLTLYFSYADGAGKTSAMLQALREECLRGVDGVVGMVDPKSPAKTLALLEGLEQIPPIHPGEFDLDAALRRKPQLLALDDLAHPNQGSRHRRRYQDVEELLKAGIDVYTTANVGEIESLSDLVQSVTGKPAEYRLPDRMFDRADRVELIDPEPQTLADRFPPWGAPPVAQLDALRQMALRRAADRLSRRSSGRGKVPYGGEHILICLSGAPSNAKVIRTAARMADAFHSEFTALYVESPTAQDMDEKSLGRLRENIRLAEDSGAQIATVYGDDLALQISEYAKAGGVTKVVIGRSGGRRTLVHPQRNLADQLMELSPNLDVYIIPDSQPTVPPHRAAREKFRVSLPDLFKTAAVVAFCSMVGLFFHGAGLGDANIITVYILGVLITSLLTSGRMYGGLASLVSVVLFNYLFTQPRFTFRAYDAGYPVTFLIMFAASFITSTLASRVKDQTRMAVQNAYRTQVLLETSQKLQQAEGAGEIFSAIAGQLVKLLDCTVLLYPVDKAGELCAPIAYPAPGQEDDPAYQAEQEQKAAQWVYQNNKHAGATTNTFPDARCLYLAVRGRKKALAVAAIAVGPHGLGAFEKSLLIAMLGECGLALEKNALDEAKQEVEIKASQEALRANLLRSISHDLRTPLTSISGNAGVLMGNSSVLDEEKKQQLYTDIYDDSIWLINLVENLLSVTRIENGTVSLSMAPELLEDLVGEALSHLSRRAQDHEIASRLEEGLLLVDCDARLIIQVLVNLVDNAMKYTPPGSHIEISAREEGAMIRVEVADDGPGIPDEAKTKLFEMFYTAGNHRGDGRRGLGLGLSLCQSIVMAHGGSIEVRDNQPHGAVFSFTLPATKMPELSKANGEVL